MTAMYSILYYASVFVQFLNDKKNDDLISVSIFRSKKRPTHGKWNLDQLNKMRSQRNFIIINNLNMKVTLRFEATSESVIHLFSSVVTLQWVVYASHVDHNICSCWYFLFVTTAAMNLFYNFHIMEQQDRVRATFSWCTHSGWWYNL